MSKRLPSSVGFRFSPGDASILAAAALLSWWLWSVEMPLWWIVPAVTVHFFLFCNVFRVRRSLELIWAGCFVINCLCCLMRLDTGWSGPMLVQAPVTLAVIAAEMMSPRYHGIFAARLNRRLNEYLEARWPAASP